MENFVVRQILLVVDIVLDLVVVAKPTLNIVLCKLITLTFNAAQIAHSQVVTLAGITPAPILVHLPPLVFFVAMVCLRNCVALKVIVEQFVVQVTVVAVQEIQLVVLPIRATVAVIVAVR
mmetsp:Transcript_41969/g.64632  ORF Transcript_41969/g.64632 Transcript_41969/m.64632 type:complete len:120 (-) Transcript_41969:123-482(-)